MKLIVQLRKNAYAFEIACARVKIVGMGEEELEEEIGEADDGSGPLDEARTHQDPSGTVYAQVERAGKDRDYANTHHCDEIRAEKPAFGFNRGS